MGEIAEGYYRGEDGQIYPLPETADAYEAIRQLRAPSDQTQFSVEDPA